MSRSRESSNDRQPHRWRLRFPLKVLLLLFTIAAVVAAWIGHDRRNSQTLVTVTVINSETGEPITECLYRYSVATRHGVVDNTGYDEWLELKSDDGSFQFHAPRSCEVWVSAQAPGYLEGFGLGYTGQTLRRNDRERKVVLELHPGVTVRGTIVDQETKQPVPKAKIAPVIFMSPLFVGDRDRIVMSDADGRFEVIGVDETLGIEVKHNDYLEMQFDITTRMLVAGSTSIYEAEVPLKVGETLTGTVRDNVGTPLAGVEVSDGSGKVVTTNADGHFVLKSPRQTNAAGYYVSFDKDGYVHQVIQDGVAGKELQIKLERLFQFRGKVVSPDGSPVTAFTIIAGPGKLPVSFECEDADVTNDAGEFSLDLDKQGEHWVAVRAKGFAVWEEMIEVSRDTEPNTIKLEAGSSVTGKVAIAPIPGTGFQVRLTPHREDPDSVFGKAAMSQEFGTLEATVQADGSFRFAHVRPDRFTLKLFGTEITPVLQELTVSNETLAV